MTSDVATFSVILWKCFFKYFFYFLYFFHAVLYLGQACTIILRFESDLGFGLTKYTFTLFSLVCTTVIFQIDRPMAFLIAIAVASICLELLALQ